VNNRFCVIEIPGMFAVVPEEKYHRLNEGKLVSGRHLDRTAAVAKARRAAKSQTRWSVASTHEDVATLPSYGSVQVIRIGLDRSRRGE